jgi:prolyl-tRNA synthetase
MATIAETHRDDKGLVWPDNIAPFKVYIARLGDKPEVLAAADALYRDLTAADVLVLYDDRLDARAGEKFADADLLGIPYRVVVSEKSVAAGQFEIKKRTESEAQMCDHSNVIKMLV